MDKKYPLQFFCRKTKKDLIEITEWFEAGKVKIGFRKYDNNEQKGSKVNASIDFYLTIQEMDLLCRNLLSGNIITKAAKGMKIDPFYKGSERDNQIYSRVFTFNKSNKGLFFTVHEGPGRKTDTGSFEPLYKLNEAPVKISISLDVEEIKSFAIQGKRACDYYYANYFGRDRG